MLANNIKIDLHIHSVASEYKDGDIVKQSNINNIDVLFDKLRDNNISLFAITDHNRFDYSLYKAIREKIAEEKLELNNLPGVEFDVVLEEGKPKCHIIAIFNDKDEYKLENLEKNIFKEGKLTKDDVYSKEEFEKIIKNIDLETILIVHQRQALDNHSSNHDSLSGATSNPYYFVEVGYIDSLEYKRPRQEGMIKNNLRKVNLEVPTITGSDCHDWNSYPFRDKNETKVPRHFTKIKCLPSFKGLLMGITSFKTRINQKNNGNQNYIKEIKIGDQVIELANGINAIIGDNGSGKSLLVNYITKDKIPTYYKKIGKDNAIQIIKCDNYIGQRITFVEQGEISNKVKDGSLFDRPEYFNDINTKEYFADQIRSYFNAVIEYVKKKSDANSALINLSKNNLLFEETDDIFFYPVIDSKIEFEDYMIHKNRYDALKRIYDMYKKEHKENIDYYNGIGIENKVVANLNDLKEIINVIKGIYLDKYSKAIAQNIIVNNLKELNDEYSEKRTSEENEKNEKIEIKNSFITSIIDTIKKNHSKNAFPTFPDKVRGNSERQYEGYIFKKVAEYHDADIIDDFYSKLFNSEYSSESKVMKIETNDELCKALKGISSISDIENFKSQRLEKFIKDYSIEKTYISEAKPDGRSIGNTPGEISLVYYKFKMRDDNSTFDILVIDQPEDDINPMKIGEFLVNYIHGIRNTKQIILVTHNPLLVVNLDVDNVVYLENINSKIKALSGPLEYETEDTSILEKVKMNLDGGYDAIERRLKVYERDRDRDQDEFK